MNSSFYNKSATQLNIFENEDISTGEDMRRDDRPAVFIMAGGTGGHIYPGLAVAKELFDKGFNIYWLGSIGGMEKELVAKQSEIMNIPIVYKEINISGVRGKGKLNYLAAPSKILKAIKQAKAILQLINPALVIGMGGFASGPGAVAAWRLKIPVVIHEQNAIAGTTNKLASKFASKILCAFPSSFKNAVVVGNPVRADIEAIDSPAKRFHHRQGPIRILVLGGSRGAQFINELVPSALDKVGSGLPFHIIHQTGENTFEKTQARYKQLNIPANVVPFIDEMAEALEWADVAICRSGALTVCELTAAGLGAVFIPYPHAISDHQTKNAEFLSNQNAAVIKQQSQLSPEIFAVFLNELLSNRDNLKYMAVRARDLHRANSAQQFANICEALVHA